MRDKKEITKLALEGSIIKWELVRLGAIEEDGSNTCALCWVFNEGAWEWEDRCKECPIYLDTKMPECQGCKPFKNWRKHASSCQKEITKCKTCQKLCNEMIRYLKNLRNKI